MLLFSIKVSAGPFLRKGIQSSSCLVSKPVDRNFFSLPTEWTVFKLLWVMNYFTATCEKPKSWWGQRNVLWDTLSWVFCQRSWNGRRRDFLFLFREYGKSQSFWKAVCDVTSEDEASHFLTHLYSSSPPYLLLSLCLGLDLTSFRELPRTPATREGPGEGVWYFRLPETRAEPCINFLFFA